MIGTYARGLRHLKNSVEDKKITNVIINLSGKITCGCITNVKLYNGREKLALFQSMYGDGKRSIDNFAKEEHERVLKILNGENCLCFFLDRDNIERFSDIIILPSEFDSIYEKFCKGNRKLLDQVFGRYCGCESSICKYIFSLTENKPNLFVWALTNIYKNRISIYTIFHILMWNENYNKLSNKLSKGSITSYNGWDNIQLLENEMFNIRCEKRVNDSINMFNTFQKKILKTVELSPKIINVFNKFARLSKTKKINFVRKMSTIDSVEEIIKQMSFLASTQFEWNKESLIEYINNVDTINAEIIENFDDILLVKVNDYETVKYLARATNWCISKNKKYWNDYVGFRDKASQYIIFDFSKKEDDKLSIIGFTTDKSVGITNAHNYVNDNLMGGGDDEDDNVFLTSFLPQNKNINIYTILKNNKLNVNKLLSTKTLNYAWNKDSFINFLKYCIKEEEYTIIKEDDESVVLTVKSENTRHLIGKGYKQVFENDDKLYNIIIFANFNYDEYDRDKILWGVISHNREKKEDKCELIMNSLGYYTKYTIDFLLEKYNLPYDTICRVFNKKECFINSLSEINIAKLNSFFKDKKLIDEYKKSKYYDSLIGFESLSSSVFRYSSFDFINCVYENNLKLVDIVNPRRLNQFIGNLLGNITDFYFDNGSHKINEEDINNFKNGNVNYHMAKYIGLVEILKIISENEESKDIFKNAISEFMDCEYEYTQMIAPLLAKNVNVNSLIYQERFINTICQYKCKEAISIILSMNPCEDIVKHMMSVLPNGELKDMVSKHYSNTNVKEPSFSIS